MITRLRTTPGVGLLTATALVAFVGDIQRFPSGRHFASYLGSPPANRPVACVDVSAGSASEASPTCACSWFISP
jgi:transposase